MKNYHTIEDFQKRTNPKNYDIRGEFYRDYTAIIHSMPFRRLKHKAQVFFSPDNDHVCTRIEHVLHVSSIAATICKGLNQFGWEVNSEMAAAIGVGHDLGHAPFGHAGETVLNNILKDYDGVFVHEVNSYRVVEKLFKYGAGLNLTFGVKDGIICHNGERFEQYLKPKKTLNKLNEIKDRSHNPSSFEGCITRFSDKIAYLGRDMEDAFIANYIILDDVPKIILDRLGDNNGKIIDTLVRDLIDNSKENDKVGFSDFIFEALLEFRDFNYKFIYAHKSIQEYKEFGENIIKTLFDYLLKLYNKYSFDYAAYLESTRKVDRFFGNYLYKMKEFYESEGNRAAQIITDYISGMTDNFALECMKEITIPKPLEFNKKFDPVVAKQAVQSTTNNT